MICYWYDAPTYFFFAEDLPGLLYYSHIPASIIALLVGFYVFLNAPKNLLNRLLLLIALSFSGWTLVNLIVWTNINADLILFLWVFFGAFQALISILSIYFIYVFLTKKDVSWKIKTIFFTLLAPVLLLGHTNLNVSGFVLEWCDAFGYEGVPFLTYYSFLGVLAMLWIGILLIRHYRLAEEHMKRQILFMGAGVELFLLMFFGATYIASFLANIGAVTDSRFEFYGLFGMTIFMTMMGILIVRFNTFNVGANTSIALMVALLVLTGSQFTYVESRTGTAITAITLIVTGLIGILLMRSVRKEIKQRKEIEMLADNLERANTRLKALDKQKSEFVSIASHQLRSPLTTIRGYASLLLEGSYGRISEKAKEPIRRIASSSKLMTFAIEDYLNVSRIESGNMKYTLTDFNLKDEVDHACDDLRQDAIKRGLALIFRSNLSSRGIIHADLGKTVQILQNLIHNSIKYTEKGSVKVYVRDDMVRKKIYVDIIDTGIGMSQETMHTIFQKFERAENANTVNVHGTGLGLFVALKMAQAMGGDISAHSDGDGKGSRFTVEFPLAL